MFFLCEIEDTNKIYKIALPKEKITGISSKLIKTPDNVSFCLFANKLYPVYSHKNLKKPRLKFFLVFEKFAFGITRIIKETNYSPKKIENNDIYTGVIFDKDEYFIYNIEKISVPHQIRTSTQNNEKKIGKDKKEYLILDEKFAIYKKNVVTILQSKEVIKFPVDKYIGFIEHKKIIPVKKITDGKHVVVTNHNAYQCNKIRLINGKVFESNDMKILKCDFGNLQILE
ncbi:hypothetical protein XJ44_06515 [Thermosipho affectus]|uniref:Uncharacterized protein n=1 Tax=Thermosipho affectus TaxID=660294 RepID=A0ABX3IGH6_9BACT|nr:MULTISPECIES: hypothetical protein [Thermosipho]ANQ54074.1 hypothetical protein Y592_06635 [Thermosipho sp. 1070]APT72519.1 hypothetical protein BG95_06555 [Thermosipho sp. 1063]ONN26942.1 hypothetical protein XJ44_06515 [Thermosipho affectus]